MARDDQLEDGECGLSLNPMLYMYRTVCFRKEVRPRDPSRTEFPFLGARVDGDLGMFNTYLYRVLVAAWIDPTRIGSLDASCASKREPGVQQQTFTCERLRMR